MHPFYLVFVEYPIEPTSWEAYAAEWRNALNPQANVTLAQSRDQAGLVLEIWQFDSPTEADDFAEIAQRTPMPHVDPTKLRVWRFEAR
jgi:hypothetical protein